MFVSVVTSTQVEVLSLVAVRAVVGAPMRPVMQSRLASGLPFEPFGLVRVLSTCPSVVSAVGLSRFAVLALVGAGLSSISFLSVVV